MLIIPILRRFLSIYSFLIISLILLEYMGLRRSRVYYILDKITNPVLSRLQIKISFGSFIVDFGPLVILLIIQYIDRLLLLAY